MNILNLYQKVSDFEGTISAEVKELSQCQSGCSRCCYVDLSVFQVEANLIRRWFTTLSKEEKNFLLEKWKEPLKESLSFNNSNVSSCTFLHNEICTIYEVRPLICRTQGSAFKYKNADSTLIDICPLNEDVLESIHDKEILNLDLLNMILTQIENVDGSGASRERISLKKLRQELLGAI